MVRHVVVIGGGVAGLTAASRLARKNFRVTLLEAADRVGGRVYTVKDQSAGTREIIEKGAQWVHGEGSTFALAKAYDPDLLEDDPFWERMETNTDFAFSTGKTVTSPEILKRYLDLFKVMRDGPSEKDCHLVSVGNWFLKESKAKESFAIPEVTAFISWLEKLQLSIDGSDTWFESSVRGQLEYIHCQGCPTILWTNGYQSLINIILNENPENSDLPDWIHLNSKVAQIDYTNKPIITRTENGEVYESDAVIVTVPLGVLKATHLDLFTPELPTVKIRSLENLGFGTVNKIHVYFEKIWWDEDWMGLNLLWTDQDMNEFPAWATNLLGFYTTKTCPHTLTSWITGEYARAIEKIDNKELTDVILSILRRFMKNNKIPRPVVSPTTWSSNPLFRGSYSFRSVQSEEKDVWAKDLAQPIPVPANGLLCFAGEATHNSFYSTVHGAHDTGIREANRLVQFFSEVEAVAEAAASQ